MPRESRPFPAPGSGMSLEPGPGRPLGGILLLAVEDSRYASDALRLCAQRLGARLRRAETLAAARAHLARYRPDALLVDQLLPDGLGSALIAELAAQGGRPVLIGHAATDGAEAALRAAGADDFLPKPLPGLAALRDTVLAHLPGRGWRDPGDTDPGDPGTGESGKGEPGKGDARTDDEGRGDAGTADLGTGDFGPGDARTATPAEGAAGALPRPDILALRDDLVQAARMLASGTPDAAAFAASVARSAGDRRLLAAAQGDPAGLARAIARRLARLARRGGQLG